MSALHGIFESLGRMLTPDVPPNTVRNEQGADSSVTGSIRDVGFIPVPPSRGCHDPSPANRHEQGAPRWRKCEGGWCDADCDRCDGTGQVEEDPGFIEACDECFVDHADYSPDLGPMPDEEGISR